MHIRGERLTHFVFRNLQRAVAVVMVASIGVNANAQDWQNVDFIQHSAYQAVNTDGSSAYSLQFPIRLRGVVLNNNEDWLDPTAAYDPGIHPYELGGEAEFYVQAVDSADTWDDGDFGGTACWMGQNYGNIHMDQDFNYTDQEWYDELDRLGLWRPGATTLPLVRAGTLVEVRARGGLYYAGKMNVNEQHSNYPDNDFEIEILDQNYGLPSPTPITLADIKDAADDPIWDPTRAAGGERYQSTLVQIENVQLVDSSGWGTNSNLVLTDGMGHTLDIHLGANESFASQPAPSGPLNVIGVMDQLEGSGIGGYRLLAMNAADFAMVPEPGTLALVISGALTLLLVGYRTRRHKV